MSALQRFLFFAGFLLFFAFNAFESTPYTVGSIIKEIAANEVLSIQMDEPAVFSCQEQAYCLLESAEEAEERSEDHFRYRPFSAALVIPQPFYSLSLANATAKAVEKTGNVRRFLIFCNWRL